MCNTKTPYMTKYKLLPQCSAIHSIRFVSQKEWDSGVLVFKIRTYIFINLLFPALSKKRCLLIFFVSNTFRLMQLVSEDKLLIMWLVWDDHLRDWVVMLTCVTGLWW